MSLVLYKDSWKWDIPLMKLPMPPLMPKSQSMSESIPTRHKSGTNFQFTNVTYLYYDEDETVRHSLDELAKFKEKARVWINDAVIDEDGFFARLIGAVATQLEIEGDLLESYKVSEVIEAFDGSRVEADVLAGRSEAFVIFKLLDDVKYVWGSEAEDYITAAAEIEESLAGEVLKDSQ